MSQAVVDTVSRAGSNPCPPIVIGVGIGGTIDMVTVLAKKALLREHRQPCIPTSASPAWRTSCSSASTLSASARRDWAARTTCLGVFIEEMPCHIASMPMAVNVQCHAQRHKRVEL